YSRSPELVNSPIVLFHCWRDRRVGELSHRKNRITIIAGISGPHHALRPSALRLLDDHLTSAMMLAAHRNALIRFSALNFAARMPAYAQAMGMAVLKPG